MLLLLLAKSVTVVTVVCRLLETDDCGGGSCKLNSSELPHTILVYSIDWCP